MKLIICEKPSVGAAIAAALGITKRKNGYIEGTGHIVSWCIGHLVGLADAGSYEERYKKWNYEDLPILPDPFRFVLSPDKEEQFAVLKGLMERKDVDGIVNACDAGREGSSSSAWWRTWRTAASPYTASGFPLWRKRPSARDLKT